MTDDQERLLSDAERLLFEEHATKNGYCTARATPPSVRDYSEWTVEAMWHAWRWRATQPALGQQDEIAAVVTEMRECADVFNEHGAEQIHSWADRIEAAPPSAQQGPVGFVPISQAQFIAERFMHYREGHQMTYGMLMEWAMRDALRAAPTSKKGGIG